MPQAVAATVAEHIRDGSDGPGSAQAPGSDFAPLLKAVRGQGLLERRTGWYAAGIAVNLVALGAVITGMFLLGDTWWNLLLALPLALLWTRTAFYGHDAGHAQITAGRKAGRVVGLVHANLLLGMNEAWWNDKHVRHHANPNHVDKDPDVGVGALVDTEAGRPARGIRPLAHPQPGAAVLPDAAPRRHRPQDLRLPVPPAAARP